MMRSLLFILLLVSLSTNAQERIVAQTFEDGSSHVVLYFKGKGEDAYKVKEEVYFENGNLDYSGEYNKEGQEDGEWTYYHNNGNVMALEYYKDGLEHGTFKEYHTDGQLFRESDYKKGELKKVTEH